MTFKGTIIYNRSRLGKGDYAMQVTEEYKNKVLQAFNRSRHKKLSKGSFKVGDRIITDVPYEKIGNDYAFDLETLEVLQHCSTKK